MNTNENIDALSKIDARKYWKPQARNNNKSIIIPKYNRRSTNRDIMRQLNSQNELVKLMIEHSEIILPWFERCDPTNSRSYPRLVHPNFRNGKRNINPSTLKGGEMMIKEFLSAQNAFNEKNPEVEMHPAKKLILEVLDKGKLPPPCYNVNALCRANFVKGIQLPELELRTMFLHDVDTVASAINESFQSVRDLIILLKKNKAMEFQEMSLYLENFVLEDGSKSTSVVGRSNHLKRNNDAAEGIPLLWSDQRVKRRTFSEIKIRKAIPLQIDAETHESIRESINDYFGVLKNGSLQMVKYLDKLFPVDEHEEALIEEIRVKAKVSINSMLYSSLGGPKLPFEHANMKFIEMADSLLKCPLETKKKNQNDIEIDNALVDALQIIKPLGSAIKTVKNASSSLNDGDDGKDKDDVEEDSAFEVEDEDKVPLNLSGLSKLQTKIDIISGYNSIIVSGLLSDIQIEQLNIWIQSEKDGISMAYVAKTDMGLVVKSPKGLAEMKAKTSDTNSRKVGIFLRENVNKVTFYELSNYTPTV